MQADIAKLRELLAKATPLLPWTVKEYDGDTEVVDASNDTICDDVRYYSAAVDADYQRLISAAITALPELLAIAEGAEADRADARRWWWLCEYPHLYVVNDLLKAGQYVTVTRAVDALMDCETYAALAGAVTQGDG